MEKFRILVTSAGSLLGQNIIDALESRRSLLHLIGTDSNAVHPRIFQCDTLHLVPPSDAQGEFAARMRELIATEKPDLVLPARDPDILMLCDLVAADPGLAARIPVGGRKAAEIMNDKRLSHRFAQRHGLPFADSLLVGRDTSSGELERFAARHGFPLIAKPSCGSGSVGVRVLLRPEHVGDVEQLRGNVVQPYLGELSGSAKQGEGAPEGAGVPLFGRQPALDQLAGQAVIAPDGRVTSLVCVKSTLVGGRVEGVRIMEDAELTRICSAYANAMAAEGWRGSFNVQLRKGREGGYQAFEMNGRMTGSTSARLRLGGDDVGEIARAWHGPDRFPCLSGKLRLDGCVLRRPADAVMLDADVRSLADNKVWHAS